MNRAKRIETVEKITLLVVVLSLALAFGIAGGIENGASLWGLLALLPCFSAAWYATLFLERLQKLEQKNRTENKNNCQKVA